MTRDEAIVVLKNEQPHCGKKALFPEEKKYEAYDVAIKALEHTRWIPIEEGYPGEMKEVLTCDKSGKIDIAYCYPCKGRYFVDQDTTEWYSYVYDDDMSDEDIPIAWMPLPAPYKRRMNNAQKPFR